MSPFITLIYADFIYLLSFFANSKLISKPYDGAFKIYTESSLSLLPH